MNEDLGHDDCEICKAARETGDTAPLEGSAAMWRQRAETAEETAGRLRETLETLASNFNAIRSSSQPYADMIDSWHYIARAALEEK